MFTDIGFTGGSAGYGMMYHAGKKTGKTDNDVMVDEIVAAVEERAAALVEQVEAAELGRNFKTLFESSTS